MEAVEPQGREWVGGLLLGCGLLVYFRIIGFSCGYFLVPWRHRLLATEHFLVSPTSPHLYGDPDLNISLLPLDTGSEYFLVSPKFLSEPNLSIQCPPWSA